MKNYLLIVFALLFGLKGIAQSIECVSALPVCSNGDINENSYGAGDDDFDNPNNEAGCLAGFEHQSLWLFIQIKTGSTLGFDISPNGLDDYDFAVFGPDVNCSNLGFPIRCSYALITKIGFTHQPKNILFIFNFFKYVI